MDYLDTVAYTFVFVAGQATLIIGGAFVALSFVYSVIYLMSMIIKSRTK